MSGDRVNTWSIGLDYSTDDISDREWSSILDWYQRVMGDSTFELATHTPFLRAYRPDLLKHFRRAIEKPDIEDPLPDRAINLLTIFLYMQMRYQTGIRYECNIARTLGTRRSEFLGTLGYAFYEGGPASVVTVVAAVGDLMEEWHGTGFEAGEPWPVHWVPTKDEHRAGLDFSELDLHEGELEHLRQWYISWQGSVPEFVEFLARTRPRALKGMRNRYENAVGSRLPRQLPPLFALEAAALRREVPGIRRVATHALRSGVSEPQLMHLVTGPLMLYLGESGMDVLARGLGQLLAV